MSRLSAEAATEVVPVEHIRTARWHCDASRPPKVTSLGDLREKIQAYDIPEMTRTRDGHELLSFMLPHNSLTVTTRRQLELLRTAEVLQMDATYKIVPKGFGSQLLTIHGYWRRSTGSYVSL